MRSSEKSRQENPYESPRRRQSPRLGTPSSHSRLSIPALGVWLATLIPIDGRITGDPIAEWGLSAAGLAFLCGGFVIGSAGTVLRVIAFSAVTMACLGALVLWKDSLFIPLFLGLSSCLGFLACSAGRLVITRFILGAMIPLISSNVLGVFLIPWSIIGCGAIGIGWGSRIRGVEMAWRRKAQRLAWRAPKMDRLMSLTLVRHSQIANWSAAEHELNQVHSLCGARPVLAAVARAAGPKTSYWTCPDGTLNWCEDEKSNSLKN